jgi:hypothetical protein
MKWDIPSRRGLEFIKMFLIRFSIFETVNGIIMNILSSFKHTNFAFSKMIPVLLSYNSIYLSLSWNYYFS